MIGDGSETIAKLHKLFPDAAKQAPGTNGHAMNRAASDIPGLEWRTSASGTKTALWVARADLVKRGYLPKAVPIWSGLEPNETDQTAIARDCQEQQQILLDWAREHGEPEPAAQKTRQAKPSKPPPEPPPVNGPEDYGHDDREIPGGPLNDPRPRRERRRFKLIPLAEIKWTATRDYLVKGLIPLVGLTLAYGPPKCGKSFWALDVAMHIADSRLYRGRRVQGGHVVYIAAEGGAGFSRRVDGWCRRNGGENAQFHLITVRPDMIGDHVQLISDIKEQLGKDKPVAIVVDTFNRTMVGSESKDVDMAKYLHACSMIEDTFACAVIVIHHCGLEKGRPRGHTSLTAGVDAQIAITRDGAGNVVAVLELAKDLEAGAEIVSSLEPVELGLDPDGDPANTLVIAAVDGKAVTSQTEPKLKPNYQTAYSILREAGQRGLSAEDWNEKLREVDIGIKRKADIYDIRKGLKDKGLVREFNGRWTAAT